MEYLEAEQSLGANQVVMFDTSSHGIDTSLGWHGLSGPLV